MTDTPDSTDDTSVNRRRVLKATAAAGTASAASGVAAADRGANFSKAEADAATAEFRDLETFEATLATESEMFEALHERDLIDEPSVDALGIETLGEDAGTSTVTAGVGAKEYQDGVTARLMVSRDLPEGRLLLGFKPQSDGAFAVIERDDSYEEVYTRNPCGSCAENRECERRCVRCGPNRYCSCCDGTCNNTIEYICVCQYDCRSWW